MQIVTVRRVDLAPRWCILRRERRDWLPGGLV